jgi:hypothetical protein
MNAKTLIAALAIIILSFVCKGLHVIDNVENTLQDNIVQQKSTTEDIGMAFDWYGLTVVDTIVKERYSLINKEQMISVLTEGKKEKDRLLEKYYSTTTPEEKDYVVQLKKYDVMVDEFVDKAISTDGRLKGGSELITEMYRVTAPPVDLINEILDLKTKVAEQKVKETYDQLESLRYYLYLLGILCVVIVAPFLVFTNDEEDS